MQLDPGTAIIGYKLSDERVKKPPQEMTSEEDYKLAMGLILQKTRNAKSKTHMLILHNLVGIFVGFSFPPLNQLWYPSASTPIHCRLQAKAE
jgi:hypothetical protein